MQASLSLDPVDETVAPPVASDRSAGPLVEVRNVSKVFSTGASQHVTALNDVSLVVPDNAFVTLLGPSGCGKTTLLRLLAGFEHPDSGHLLIDGNDVVANPPNKRPVNTVFQSYALFPHMSVAQNIAFGLEQIGKERTAIRMRVAEMLALVRLAEMADRRPAQLSGGQQQRVALARALAPAPRLLLLDEPLSALDLKLRRGMQVELKRLQHETGITFLLVTHDQEEALSMSDRIAVMNAGRILQIGPPDEIHERPRSRFVAEFMGANVIAGHLAGFQSAYVAIRPGALRLARFGGHGALTGRLRDRTYLGDRTSCSVVLGDGTVLEIEGTGIPSDLVSGESVACSFERRAVVPLDE